MIRFINTFFLGYVILWPLIFKFILPVDGAGRGYMLLAAIVMLFNISDRNFRVVFKIGPVFIWLIWVIYTTFNWFLSGYPPPDNMPSTSFVFVYLILPWLSMCVALYETKMRLNSFLKDIHVLLFAYVLLGIIFQINTLGSGRRGGDILGNSLPLISLCLTFVACLRYNLKHIKTFSLLSSVIVSILSIFMVATRKAFGGELLILFFFLLSNIKKLNFKSLFKVAFLLVLFYFSISFVLNNSTLGERFFSISDAADEFNTSDFQILSFLGDRAYFYISGWDLFLESPLCGIGISNFMNVTDYPMPIHSEYMVQLTENGLIGFSIFLLFFSAMFRQMRNIFCTKVRWVFYGWLVTVLFISFTSWVYDFTQYFILYGIILGLVWRENKKGSFL